MESEQNLILNEEQITLLQNFEPFEQVLSAVEESDLFCFHALNSLGRLKEVNQQIELINTALKRKDISFVNPQMLSHNIINVIKQDRAAGLRLLLNIIRNRTESEFDEHYISESIGPLTEKEITEFFDTFEAIARDKYGATEFSYPIRAKFFLPRCCSSDFITLISCLKSWLKDPRRTYFAIDLCREISKFIFESNEDRSAEKNQLVDVIINDLTEKGIKINKQFDPRMPKHEYSDYIDYLTWHYRLSEYDKEKVIRGYKEHKELASFVPDLAKQFDNGAFEHPLAGYLEYVNDVGDAISKIRTAMQAELAAENATWSIIELWDMEENLRDLEKQPGIKGEIKEKLSNPAQFEDTFSELTVSRILNKVGKFELLKKEFRVEGRLIFENEKINVEVARPKMDSILEHGLGGGIHPFSRASIIKEKLEKIKNIESGLSMPFLMIFDASRSNLDAENVANYLLGTLKYFYAVDKKTGAVIKNQGFIHDPKEVGLDEEDSKLVSAVLIYKRKRTVLGIRYSAEIVLNPKAANPISEKCMSAINSAFNAEIYCPTLTTGLQSISR